MRKIRGDEKNFIVWCSWNENGWKQLRIMNNWKKKSSVVKGGGVGHKGENLEKIIKIMHEYCLVVIIIAWIEKWRVNGK